MTNTNIDTNLLVGGDLPVRRLGLGTMRYADHLTARHGAAAPVWEAPTDRDALLGVIRTAVERGVDLVDTADAYALGAGEELVAEALAPVDAPVVVATKVGVLRPSPDAWVPLGHPDYLRQQIELSLRRLRRETIDLLYLHRVDELYPIAEQVGALSDAVRQGKVRHLGLSEVSTAQLDAARETAPIAAVQNLYNLAAREHDPVVERTRELGIAFVPFFPINFDPASVPALADVARAHGATPQQVALAWLLHRGPHVVPIPGTTSVAHLAENLAAQDVALSEAEQRRLASSPR
ncbi:aldo/keto reductase [Isoptericola sp. BMS4]|uniref:aldo/keto reductase n=1 Tax=Isoptericola sp. BMS4 TaxID=2527875 RepID=UPI001420CA3B|nr:aldo/keto reductase [Isoptericola sp. BMS4]